MKSVMRMLTWPLKNPIVITFLRLNDCFDAQSFCFALKSGKIAILKLVCHFRNFRGIFANPLHSKRCVLEQFAMILSRALLKLAL